MSSKPTFQLVRLNNAIDQDPSDMSGGFSYGNHARDPLADINDIADQAELPADAERINLYKAKKYHYKCQAKIKSLMAEGKQCPSGFEKYLEQFSS